MTQRENNAYRIDIGKRRLALTAALLQATKNIRQIDDLFQWLAASIVQQFGVQMVQFWIAQAGYNGQFTMQQLALASKDNLLPQRIALSKPVADLAESIMTRRSAFAPGPLSMVFPYFHANLFQRFGLYYCSGEFLSSNVQAPFSNADLADQARRERMDVATLFFFGYEPAPELQRSISYILQLAAQIAETNSMFLPMKSSLSNIPGYQLQFQQSKSSALFKLVPRRKAEAELMTTSTPLAGTMLIADKLARRLYQAIDGHKNVGELRTMAHLDNQEIAKALQILLDERRIELLDSNGQPVDGSTYFNEI